MLSPRAAFRFVYGSTYFVLCALLVGLLCITPGDLIYQAYVNDQWYNIWLLAAAVVGVLVIVSFIYALRLYNNKTILASIPKAWVPIDKGDLPKRVFHKIVAGLDRSAVVAFEARPRVLKTDTDSEDEQGQEQEKQQAPLGGFPVGTGSAPETSNGNDKSVFNGHGPQEQEKTQIQSWPTTPDTSGTKKQAPRPLQLLKIKDQPAVEALLGSPLPPPPFPGTPYSPPVWGDIEHGGWSSPSSSEMPNLQYGTVLSELPHLIEAKALTLAPPDPTSAEIPPMLDPDAVTLLERPPALGLRAYLSHLSELGVLPPANTDATAGDFLAAYERARFSARPMSGAEFSGLMRLFAGLLRAMGPMDPAVLGDAGSDGFDPNDRQTGKGSGFGGDEASRYDTASATDSDLDNDEPASDPSTPRGSLSRSVTQSTRSTTARKRLHPFHAAAQTTAGGSGRVLSRSSSMASFAQTRKPYHMSSNASLRSKASSKGSGRSGASSSGVSHGGSSVIRLARGSDATDLPYVLSMKDTR